MAEISNELIYEVLKAMQLRLANIETKLGEVSERMNAITLHSLGMQTDIKNIYATLGKIETRVERIEHRLDLVGEPAQ